MECGLGDGGSDVSADIEGLDGVISGPEESDDRYDSSALMSISVSIGVLDV